MLFVCGEEWREQASTLTHNYHIYMYRHLYGIINSDCTVTMRICLYTPCWICQQSLYVLQDVQIRLECRAMLWTATYGRVVLTWDMKTQLVYLLLRIPNLRGNHPIACSGKPNLSKRQSHLRRCLALRTNMNIHDKNLQSLHINYVCPAFGVLRISRLIMSFL